MPNINDTYASVLSGYSGSVNDRRSELLTGILAYAKPLSLNDMEAAALASLGYTGALNDAWDKYIKALGGFGISAKSDYLSSTFYGNPVPFLFASAQPGVWYDPSDLTTMFQDNLGSTPVTAPGQTVGLLLDKSKNGVGTNGSSRRNLLVATATLSTQSVTVTAVAHTLSFTGTGTVTLTGASIAGPLIGTGASNRVSLTFTPTAGSLTLTVLGSVTLAQLEIGSTATAYQPITTSWAATMAGNHATQATLAKRPIYQVDSSGKPYLLFDGVDDGMVTGTITPATDKVQVFAGVRKLSDTAVGTIVELSADTGSNNGTFVLFASFNGGAVTPSYLLQSKGTVRSGSATPSSYPAPITNVFTGVGDISGDTATVRVNGTQVATSTADQGTGNYLAYPLYIGARGGSSLFFNGRLYSMIVRFGANLTTGQITSTEKWVNSKTGAF
jgi:hypothetical protein